MDVGAYDDCMSSLKYAGRIQASSNEGVRLGVGSTPSFVIGGRLYPGLIPYDRMRALVDSLSAAAP
jgi:protein-disulfide isomerase